MNSLKAPSLQSLMDSDRASNDSQYTDYNIQLDLEEVSLLITDINTSYQSKQSDSNFPLYSFSSHHDHT